MLRLLASLGSGVLAAAALAGPQAVAPEISYNAGEVRLGDDVVHDFIIVNAGDAPLRLLEVSPSCACLLVDYDATIAPASRGKVRARIRLEDLPPGRASKTIAVATDDPALARIVFQVKLTLIPPVEFLTQGGGVHYVTTQRGLVKEDRILVRTHEAGLKLLGASSSDPSVEVELRLALPAPTTPGGPAPQAGDYWLTVRVRADAAPGRCSAVVRVRTSSAAHPEAVLRVESLVAAAAPGRGGS